MIDKLKELFAKIKSWFVKEEVEAGKEVVAEESKSE